MTPALQQYIDLYRQCEGSREATPLLSSVNSHGYRAMVRIAGAARRDTSAVPEASPLRLLTPDYGININRVALPVDVSASFRCGVPQLGSLMVVMANDAFHYAAGTTAAIPDGLTICSLRDVPDHLCKRVEAVMLRSLERDDAAAAVDAAFLSDGVLIHVSEGTRVDKAIQIVNISNPATPLLSPRRVVVLADAGSSVRVLLCDHSQTATVEHLNIEVVDVDCAAGSHVEVYDIEEGTPASRRLWQVNGLQADGAHLTVCNTYLHGGVTRNDYHIDATGDTTDTSLSGLAICADTHVVDTNVTLRHTGHHGTSRQIFKNALFDNSRGGFGGKIIVAGGAMYTDAEQTNRNLLASEEARMTAAPQLEIYCDEVKCSHGATTGQLDERALFYMQSRGIPAEEARRMLTQAFMVDVIDNISFEVLRQRIHQLVERRLSGRHDSCDSCSACHTDR